MIEKLVPTFGLAAVLCIVVAMICGIGFGWPPSYIPYAFAPAGLLTICMFGAILISIWRA